MPSCLVVLFVLEQLVASLHLPCIYPAPVVVLLVCLVEWQWAEWSGWVTRNVESFHCLPPSGNGKGSTRIEASVAELDMFVLFSPLLVCGPPAANAVSRRIEMNGGSGTTLPLLFVQRRQMVGNSAGKRR